MTGVLVIPATLTVAVVGVLSACSSDPPNPSPQDAATDVAMDVSVDTGGGDSGRVDSTIADSVITDTAVVDTQAADTGIDTGVDVASDTPPPVDNGCPTGVLFCIPDPSVDAGHGGTACNSTTCDPSGCPAGCRAVG